MLKTIEFTIEMNGEVRLRDPLRVAHPCRAIVTILDETNMSKATLLSEKSLACDWEKPEEEAAWAHLQ